METLNVVSDARIHGLSRPLDAERTQEYNTACGNTACTGYRCFYPLGTNDGGSCPPFPCIRIEQMSQPLVEMAKELMVSMIQAGTVSPDQILEELHKTHASLLALKAREATGGSRETPEPEPGMEVIDWKPSIRRDSISCLVCGETFKQLSARHLKRHDLDPKSYRQQFGIPKTQKLSAKVLTRRRREVVQQIRPWEQTPAYLRNHPAKKTRRKAD